MPPKKRNGLSMYISSVMQPDILKTTGKMVPIQQLINEAVPIYNQLSTNEKNHYEQLAKDFNRDIKGKKMNIEIGIKKTGTNYDNTCLLIDESLKKSLIKSKDILFQKLSKMSIPEIRNESFFFIGAEVMCLLLDESMPLLELGIVEITLKDAIVKQHHKLVYPGQIPIGFRSAVNENSQNRHQIPVEKFVEGERNYADLYQNIINFFNGHQLIAYCREEDTKQVFRSLNWLYDKARLFTAPSILIGKIEDLLEGLYSSVGTNLDIAEIKNILSVSYYDYGNHCRCPYHDEEINANYCALASTKKNCLIFMENLSNFYNIELTDKHLELVTNNAENQAYTSDEISFHNKNPKEENVNNEYKNPASKDEFNFGSRDIRYIKNQSNDDITFEKPKFEDLTPQLKNKGHGSCIVDSVNDFYNARSELSLGSVGSEFFDNAKSKLSDGFYNSTNDNMATNTGFIRSSGPEFSRMYHSSRLPASIPNNSARTPLLIRPDSFKPTARPILGSMNLRGPSSFPSSALPKDVGLGFTGTTSFNEDAFETMSMISSLSDCTDTHSQLEMANGNIHAPSLKYSNGTSLISSARLDEVADVDEFSNVAETEDFDD